MGDARLSLEREPPQNYDVLALDAFSSDAIPVHLLTEEAFEIYLRHLKPDGVLAVHTSNRYLALDPIVLGAAARLGLSATMIEVYADEDCVEVAPNTWVLLSADAEFIDTLTTVAGDGASALPAPAEPWTDDYSDLIRRLR